MTSDEEVGIGLYGRLTHAIQDLCVTVCVRGSIPAEYLTRRCLYWFNFDQPYSHHKYDLWFASYFDLLETCHDLYMTGIIRLTLEITKDIMDTLFRDYPFVQFHVNSDSLTI